MLEPSAQELLSRINLVVSSPAQRMEAVTLLGSVDANIAAEALEEALVSVLTQDNNPIVRHEAAFILGHLFRLKKIEGTLALETICRVAENDASVVVRHEAAESLASFPSQQARKTLHMLLGDPSPDVVATARIALEHFSPIEYTEDTSGLQHS